MKKQKIIGIVIAILLITGGLLIGSPIKYNALTFNSISLLLGARLFVLSKKNK